MWIIYPHRKDENGNQGVAKLLYDLGEKAKDSLAIYSDITEDGKFAYFTITLGNHVAALDISDLDNVKRLDDPTETQPIIGPHYLKISPDRKNLVVTGYFVQAGDVSCSPLFLNYLLRNQMFCWRFDSRVNTATFCPSPQISILNTPGDYKVHYIDILPSGALSFNRTLDFENIFSKDRGGARPHSSVIFDLSDPENPKYY